jgi:FkbM family methyltransferase
VVLPMLKQLGSVLRRRRLRAAAFVGLRCRLLSHYDWLLRHAIRAPLPFRSRVVRVAVKGQPTPFHARLGNSDFAVLGEVFEGGEYDGVWEVGPQLPTSGPRILDLGANIGTTVRMWLDQHPGAEVIAVEPSEANLELARANVALVDGDNRVTFLQACVDAQPGTVRITDDAHGWEVRIARNNENPTGGALVPALTIAQILDEHWPGEEVDLLKSDIEGAEQAVFADCGAWIGRIRRIAIEIEAPYSAEQLFADIERHDVKFEHKVKKSFGTRQVLLLWRV